MPALMKRTVPLHTGPSSGSPGPRPVRDYWSFASNPSSLWWLISAVTLARIIYLGLFCPYTLAEDEAFYWEWSRHLDLSYYTKGPGIAWFIRSSTALLGTSEFSVRLPAALSSAVLSLAVGLWARDVARDEGSEPAKACRTGFFAACCTLLLPMFQASSLLMTIDGPYAAAWSVAGWLGYRAMVRGRAWVWSLAAALVGVSFLFKYTALMLPLSWLIAWAVSPRLRNGTGLRPLPLFVAVLVFGVIVSPVVIWNVREGWPTIAHLLGHLGFAGGDVAPDPSQGKWRYEPAWTASYIAGQFALAGPVFGIGIIGAIRAFRSSAATGRRLVAWCAVPLLTLYLVVSFITEPEGNWAFAAHVAGCVLAGGVVESAMTAWKTRVAEWKRLPRPRPREGFLFARPASGVQVLWHSSLIAGVLVAVAIAGLPVVDGFWKQATGAERSPIPVGRFTGADTMAEHVTELADALRASAPGEPFVCGLHYGRAAQLAFYLPGRPTVVCASSMIAGGRRTQYDWWPETRLDYPSLAGRPAVVVGGRREDWLQVFDSVGEPITLRGDGKRGRPAFSAVGLRPERLRPSNDIGFRRPPPLAFGTGDILRPLTEVPD